MPSLHQSTTIVTYCQAKICRLIVAKESAALAGESHYLVRYCSPSERDVGAGREPPLPKKSLSQTRCGGGEGQGEGSRVKMYFLFEKSRVHAYCCKNA